MGENTVTFSYALADVLHTERNETTRKSSLIMSVPLLCGFDYPVKALSFSITMPGDVSGKKPTFTSGFLQTNIDSIVNCVTGGSLIHTKNTETIANYGLYSPDDPGSLRPKEARIWIDRRYILAAMGLLAEYEPQVALHIMKKELIPDGYQE